MVTSVRKLLNSPKIITTDSNKANRNDTIKQGKILFISREIVYFMTCIAK